MSILIKGMDMPKRCVECEWHEYYGGDYDWVHACRRTGTMPIENAETERANDCPLVEIPEHGRLIDADALNIGEYEREDDDTGTLEISLGGLLDLYHKVKDAPAVVIEAEGDEDGENHDD